MKLVFSYLSILEDCYRKCGAVVVAMLLDRRISWR